MTQTVPEPARYLTALKNMTTAETRTAEAAHRDAQLPGITAATVRAAALQITRRDDFTLLAALTELAEDAVTAALPTNPTATTVRAAAMRMATRRDFGLLEALVQLAEDARRAPELFADRTG